MRIAALEADRDKQASAISKLQDKMAAVEERHKEQLKHTELMLQSAEIAYEVQRLVIMAVFGATRKEADGYFGKLFTHILSAKAPEGELAVERARWAQMRAGLPEDAVIARLLSWAKESRNGWVHEGHQPAHNTLDELLDDLLLYAELREKKELADRCRPDGVKLRRAKREQQARELIALAGALMPPERDGCLFNWPSEDEQR